LDFGTLAWKTRSQAYQYMTNGDIKAKAELKKFKLRFQIYNLYRQEEL
jgi:hypothetical protein